MDHERLAYTLREVAEKLGGISVRSVQRLVARGLLRTVPGLRRVLIPADALRQFVARGAAVEDNPPRAEPVAWKGTKPCYSKRAGSPFWYVRFRDAPVPSAPAEVGAST